MRKLCMFATLAACQVLPRLSHAQKVIFVDSLTLFETRQNLADAGKGIRYSRGFVASVIPLDEGYQINVFKQYTGLLTFAKGAPVSKDYMSFMTALPGLAQYRYNDEGILLQKEKAFDLTGAGQKPFNYDFYEITGVRGSNAPSTEGRRVISNPELGGNYGMLLTAQPAALAYSGARKTLKKLYRPGAKVAGSIKQQAVFDLYTGRYWDDPDTETRRQSLTMKVDQKNPVSFQIDPDHIFYLRPVEKGLLSVMKIDTLLKEYESAHVQFPENFGVLNYKEVTGVPDKKRFTLTELENCKTGMVLLMGDGFIDRKNARSYSLVRLDSQGKLQYKHDFTIESDGYLFDRSILLANTDENIIKIILRKGLKFQMYYVRVNAEGVTYQSEWAREQEKAAKQVNSFGESGMPGRGQETFVIALPDGGSLIGGADFGVGAPGGVQKGYGYTQLGPDGITKAFYSTDCYIPAAIMGKAYSLGAMHVGEGKVMIIANEPRGNKPASWTPYSVLTTELCKEYTLLPGKDEDGNLVVHLGPHPAAAKTRKSGFKLPGGLEVVSGLGAITSSHKSIEEVQTDNTELVYAPAVYLIDTRQQTIKKLDLHFKDSYTISDSEGIWINTEKRELDVFLKGREKSLEKSGGLPTGILLKAVKVSY